MELECTVLSYSTEALNRTKNGLWWWNGAPVFNTEHTIKVLNNGQRIEFNKETGGFRLVLESLHEIKMGILEIFILVEGIFSNDLIGYAFTRVEDLLIKRDSSIFYLKILQTNDPINGWMSAKQTISSKFKPKEMEFYLALSVTKNKIKKQIEKKTPFIWGIFLKNENITGRIFDLQEAFLFLFRDMNNISEFVYGLRELFFYYIKKDEMEFKEVPPYPFEEEKKSFLKNFRRRIFGPRESDHVRRIKYSQYLKRTIPRDNQFKWHVETESFYITHIKNYRYAIAPYGQAFLHLHSLLNVIKNKITNCQCIQCTDPKINQEEKYFHLFTGIPYADILHGDSKYLEHVIFIDREEKCLYITFKGTLHSREALIDIDYKYYRYKRNLFHRGIFIESQRFFNEKKEIISYHMKENSLHRIKLVGQSLGGGLAMLVWMFMKESALLRGYSIGCIAYSPPPIISNPGWFRKLPGNDINDLNNTVSVVVYGNDIIPTLCLGKVFELKLLATHFYAISISNYKNKEKYIHAILKKMNKRGIKKLYIPGRIYKIRHTRTNPSTFLVKRTRWNEYSSIKLWAKALVHHTPGAMINSLQKSLRYFYTEEADQTTTDEPHNNPNYPIE